MVTVIPVFAGIFFASLVGPLALKIAVWVGGAAVGSFIHMKFIPLERR